MKICLLLEGCYPYVRGGVSTWSDGYIRSFSEHEFVLWTVAADREMSGIFKYTLPDNCLSDDERKCGPEMRQKCLAEMRQKRVDEVEKHCEENNLPFDEEAEKHKAEIEIVCDAEMEKKCRKKCVQEIFLNDAFDPPPALGGRKEPFTQKELDALSGLVRCEVTDWETIFSIFEGGKVVPQDFLRSETFLDLLNELCMTKYQYAPFSEVFYTVRSMVLPLLHILTQPVPEADVYHSIATGYCGILGALGALRYKKPLVITEHGIYTREREEEILRSRWTVANLKDMWIQFFNMLSLGAYQYATYVTSLFEHAKETQINLGCPAGKASVINNGITLERFETIPPKEPDGHIDIGAVVRIAQIKDIKTMIYAFSELKHSVPHARLHIMGDVDDKTYAKECHQLVDYLKTEDIIFTGSVNVVEYFKKLDFTILTSISEGQPLSILESMAAGRPVVSTDVGSCRELLEGRADDELGSCGFICPPMDPGALAYAMKRMCVDDKRRDRMSEIGKDRVREYYTREIMISQYRDLYITLEKGASA